MNKRRRQGGWRCWLCPMIAFLSITAASRAATAQFAHDGARLGSSSPAASWLGAGRAFLDVGLYDENSVVRVGVVAQGDPVTIEKGRRDYLEPNRPNPFGAVVPITEIAYAIAEDTHVRLTIYDFFYSKVLTLVDDDQKAGRYVIPFAPPATLPSGMYFYELVTGRSRELRRMMYIK